MFIEAGLTGFLNGETITRNKLPGHTNWWAKMLQALPPGRMNLASGKIVNSSIQTGKV